MFYLKASARDRIVALAMVLCVAAAGCAPARTSAPVSVAPVPEDMALGPAQERHAEALAQYATGVSEEIHGNLDAAVDRYQKVLELDPHYTSLAIRLGRIYATKHDITNAVSLLELTAKANPNDPEVAYWLGSVYAEENDGEKAAVEFRRTLKLDPDNLDAVGHLLDIYIQKDSLSEVVSLLDHAYHQKVDASAYWSRLGDLYAVVLRQKPSWAQKMDRKRIQQCYEKSLALGSDDPDVELRLADNYSDSGDYQKAADAYSKLLAKNPDSPLIRQRQAANYIRADQKDKAIAVLEEIIKREPLANAIYNYLGELYAESGKTDKAIFNYQQSLVIKPNQRENYAQITALQLDANQSDQALLTLATWKEKFPTDFRVPYFTGLIQIDRKQYPAAVASFTDAESLAQDAPEEIKPSSQFYFSFGAACERAGDTNKAVALFRKCLQIDPQDHTACNYLGYMWADEGVNLDEALTLIQKAVKLSPDNGAYIDSLGWVLFKLGRNEEALVQLRRAVELVKPDAVVYGHLADVLVKLGKSSEALTILRRASELEPDNKEISQKIQKLKSSESSAR